MAGPVDPLERLPHQPPFRFLSRVLEREPGVSGVGVWSVSGAEAFFVGHFPGEPIVPGVLIAEALAQLAGVVAFVGAGSGPEPRAAHLAQVNVRFFKPIAPPAEILLRAWVARAIGGLRLMEVRADCRGEIAASGQVTLAVAGGPVEGRA
jgi:3-hydroxyacyl-[acyl-carrier-protein] dehydratase